MSNVLRYQAESGSSLAAGTLAKVSLVAWHSIDYCDRYEYTKSFQLIDIDEIVRELLSWSGVYPKTCTLKMDFIVVLRDEDYKQILNN